MRHSTLLFLLAVTACALPAVGQDDFGEFNEPAKEPGARPADNIALGAPYTLSPAPNYEHCTDSDDAKQLTDGVYSEGYFWVQPSTVGWKNSKPVIVTLDLGKVRPIRGLSFHTAAGRAGVAWPLTIGVYVADVEKQFHMVGELIALSAKHGLPEPDDYDTHRYWTDALKAHGRYLALAILAQPYAFVDEIEVYAGEPDWVNLPLAGEPISDIKAHTGSLLTLAAVKRRLISDLQGVRDAATQSSVAQETRQAILEELEAIAQAIQGLSADVGPDFRAVLPLNPLHACIFEAQARLWQAKGHGPITLWQSTLWDALSHLAEPPSQSGAAVRVDMMLNEYRAGAFNVSNATPERAAIKLTIAGLPGGANPDYVTVHEVAWTDTNAGQPVAAALPVAARSNGAYVIDVPSGMTRQVWLTVHPTEVEPSEHRGTIQLACGDTDLEVPLTLKLYPFRFPDKASLHFGGWDYTDGIGQRGVTAENRALLVAHLHEHFVDAPWATSGVLPHGTHDSTGAMSAAPDTSRFDAWLALWPDAGQYRVFASVGANFDQWRMGTPEFSTAVQAWATFWAGHAREKGVEPEQLALLLVDEPHRSEQDEIILAWAQAIRAAETGLRIWEDPIYKDMDKANPEMVAACHVLCPNRPIFLRADQGYRDYFAEQRERGISLEFYSCSGPARLLDPYSYYRLQAWDCWQHGAEATYFWALADTGGASSWNEYTTKHNAYTPLFLDDTSVTAGKRLEVCREAVEDYEYFVMLAQAIADAPGRGVDDAVIARARGLLAELPAQVLEAGKTSGFRWVDDLDRTLADQARVAMLDAMVELSGSR